MYFKSTTKLFGLTAFLLLFYACKKEKNQEKKLADLATFEVTRPAEGQSFDKNDTIILSATAFAPFEIHGYSIQFKKFSNDSIIWNSYRHTHGKQILIFDFLPVSELIPNDKYKVIFILHVDHSNDKLVVEREVLIK